MLKVTQAAFDEACVIVIFYVIITCTYHMIFIACLLFCVAPKFNFTLVPKPGTSYQWQHQLAVEIALPEPLQEIQCKVMV